MIKINPINSNLKLDVKNLNNKNILNKFTKPPYVLGASILGATGLVLSTFLKDFRKTTEEDNYFQLKINPDTNKLYKADVFQNAAAMNLFLGNDVTVTAPTGTGKTAIAQYVITKNLKEGKKTFYTTPLKALSNEKYRDFCKTYGEENVGIITGDTKINQEAPIIIMTTEVYRNMAFKDVSDKLAEELFGVEPDNKGGIPKDLKTVIFDELQYLGDVDRGGIWEQSIMYTPQNVQMLSLSATIGNNEEINNWIATNKGRKTGVSVTPDLSYRPDEKNVETVLINVPSENRHVPLNFEILRFAAEMPKLRGGTKKQKIEAKKEAARKSQSIYAKADDEAFKHITKMLLDEDKLPAIYFIFSKKECKHHLKHLSRESEVLTTEAEREEIARIIKEEYIDKNIYLGEGLDTGALLKGYAIHNAGLLPTQKRLVEELFQKKLVKVVLATETLSAGINMPAKTTVISSPRKPASTSDGGQDHKRNLSPNEFHQMAGRAGRRGIDTKGYCYAIACNGIQKDFYSELIKSTSNRLDSNLDLDYSFIVNLSESFDDEKIEKILSKSFYVYDEQKSTSDYLLYDLMGTLKIKRGILIDQNFIEPSGKLTLKGELLKHLNGYEQIPIINLVADKVLADRDPVQIAGLISGMANIEYELKGEFPEKPLEVKRQDDHYFAKTSEVIMKRIRNYNHIIEDLDLEVVMSANPKVMDHLYTWAELNSKCEDSRKNWKELFEGELRFSIRDEGTLFKEITMTIDLLKQLIMITQIGEKYSEHDKEYYHDMTIKFKDALELIQREPAAEM